jgi:hypothetical protein
VHCYAIETFNQTCATSAPRMLEQCVLQVKPLAALRNPCASHASSLSCAAKAGVSLAGIDLLCGRLQRGGPRHCGKPNTIRDVRGSGGPANAHRGLRTGVAAVSGGHVPAASASFCVCKQRCIGVAALIIEQPLEICCCLCITRWRGHVGGQLCCSCIKDDLWRCADQCGQFTMPMSCPRPCIVTTDFGAPCPVDMTADRHSRVCRRCRRDCSQ